MRRVGSAPDGTGRAGGRGPRRARAAATLLGLGALAAGAGWVGGCAQPDGPGDEAAGAEEAEPGLPAWVLEDARLAPLFAGCARSDVYDRNVADTLPILIGKLESGQLEPLRRAKEELAAAGEEALPELRRLFDRAYSDPHGFAVLQNVLDVLQQTSAPGARDLLVRALDHPSSAVRQRAIQGLRAGRARPEDFDRLLLHLEIEDPEQRHVVALALHDADPPRAEALYLDWIEASENASFWSFVALLLPGSDVPATRERCAALQAGAPPTLRPWLAACAAAGGDAEARAWIAATLADPDPALVAARSACLRACGEAGLEELCVDSVVDDPDRSARTLAVQVVAGLWPEDEREEPPPEVRDVLRAALDDVAESVRLASFGALVARGDPVAVDRGLAKLLESPRRVNEAMVAFLPRLPTDAALAERVHAKLLERDALEEGLPLERRLATLKSLGQIPTAEAARALRAIGLAHPGVIVEGLSAHEWTCLQASNTGEAGRAWLGGELARETDELRRLDLLWATSAARSDATRERLLALLDDPALAPHEVLFVADRLTRLGPASRMAGRLKRATNRMEQPTIRRAMQCLMWRWY